MKQLKIIDETKINYSTTDVIRMIHRCAALHDINDEVKTTVVREEECVDSVLFHLNHKGTGHAGGYGGYFAVFYLLEKLGGGDEGCYIEIKDSAISVDILDANMIIKYLKDE